MANLPVSSLPVSPKDWRLNSDGSLVAARRPLIAATIPSGGAAPTSRVLLIAGNGYCGTYALEPGKTLTLGRDQASEVPLDDPKISRRHACLHVGEAIEVEDLGSTNGTRLAGRRLDQRERTVLQPGINLQLGPFLAVVLQQAGQASSDQPLRAAIPVTDPTPSGVPTVVARLAAEQIAVLINGETGVGKEVLARTIHELSGRDGKFVAINCAALSETLLESELFGHERGAFTGASASKPGLFEVARGGTVFLDEIGELSPSLQARLLRVLETRTAYRVGGVAPVSLDVRFVSATHRDLAQEIPRGGFRRDLYFRINGIVLSIVPLRARRNAIPRLARELLQQVAPPGKQLRLGATALAALIRHDWPGNVRELRNVMERAAVMCEGEEVRGSHILLDEPAHGGGAAPPPPVAAAAPAPLPAGGGDEDPERTRIVAALAECAGNQTYAARRLGISRTTLRHKLVVHRIPRPRKPNG